MRTHHIDEKQVAGKLINYCIPQNSFLFKMMNELCVVLALKELTA